MLFTFKKVFLICFFISLFSISGLLLVDRLVAILFSGSVLALIIGLPLSIPFYVLSLPTLKITESLFPVLGVYNHPFIHYLIGTLLVGLAGGIIYTLTVQVKNSIYIK